MLLTQVALVPFREDLVGPEELLNVAAALQTQVTRDLSPIWGVSGCVSPFRRLQDVPAGYLPLAIVSKGDLPDQQPNAFHQSTHGQPVGLVAYVDGWSLLASHELVEIFCDPWGKLTAPGVREDQRVQYLVEVCDPCQFSSYQINGVPVSDFVTPRYYDEPATTGLRYSFTGSVEHPLQILEGGYISWSTLDGKLWQAFSDGKPVALDVAPQFTRDWVDSHPGKDAPDITHLIAQLPARPYVLSDPDYGSMLERDIDRVLQSIAPVSAVSRDEFLALVYRLGHDQPYYDSFNTMNGAAKLEELQKLKIDTTNLTVDTFPAKIPDMAEYQQLFDDLNEGRSFGPPFDREGAGKRLMSLGAFINP